ncbi:exosortase A [Roseomonas sp. WA12]
MALAVLAFAFSEEVAAAVRVWDNSATYNHCWLVLPIVGYLAWSRRHRLIGLTPRPSPLLALLAIPPALAWLAAERLGIMEGRQLAVIGLVWATALGILGWPVCRTMAAPLAYLVFLVPFGAFVTPALQSVTARFIDLGLDLTAIPHFVDDLVIETPAGTFLVAEACAGLRFLIAAVAFGALYALTMFRSPGRRLIVLILAVIIPVIANGLRAFGIVALGSYLGSAEAAAADHVIYGWAFFSAVIFLLTLAGLPFREDTAPEPVRIVTPAPVRPSSLATAVAIIAVITLAGPSLGAVLGQAGGRAPERRLVHIPELEGCGAPAGPGTLICGGVTVRAEMLVFPGQVTWGAVSAERGRLTGGDDQDLLFTPVGAPNGSWRARQSADRGTTIALAAWLNGRPAGTGMTSRAEQAWNSLGLGTGVPVLVAVTLGTENTGFDGLRQRAVLETLLRARGGAIAAEAAAASTGRPPG